MAAASVLVTAAGLFIVLLNYEQDPDHMYVYPPILAGIGALMLPYHLVRFVLGR